MVVLEEHPTSILRAGVCRVRNWFGYIEKLKEDDQSDPWEEVRKWNLIQTVGN
jgi:hypothetical protein